MARPSRAGDQPQAAALLLGIGGRRTAAAVRDVHEIFSTSEHGREGQPVGTGSDNGRSQGEAKNDLVRSVPFHETSLFRRPLRQQLAGEKKDGEKGAESTQAEQPVVKAQPKNNSSAEQRGDDEPVPGRKAQQLEVRICDQNVFPV